MKTLMDKINHFETTAGTVAEFNEIFTVKLEGVCPSLEVGIGELVDSDTTRMLTVGKLLVKHNFRPRLGKEDNKSDYMLELIYDEEF